MGSHCVVQARLKLTVLLDILLSKIFIAKGVTERRSRRGI
jgi:hypothetical protein